MCLPPHTHVCLLEKKKAWRQGYIEPSTCTFKVTISITTVLKVVMHVAIPTPINNIIINKFRDQRWRVWSQTRTNCEKQMVWIIIREYMHDITFPATDTRCMCVPVWSWWLLWWEQCHWWDGYLKLDHIWRAAHARIYSDSQQNQFRGMYKSWQCNICTLRVKLLSYSLIYISTCMDILEDVYSPSLHMKLQLFRLRLQHKLVQH